MDNITKNKFGFVEDDQAIKIIHDLTGGGTVADALSEPEKRMILEAYDMSGALGEKRPIGPTLFRKDFQDGFIELVRCKTGGHGLYSVQGGVHPHRYFEFLNEPDALIWCLENDFVNSIAEFIHANDLAMFRNEGEILKKLSGSMAHKMESQETMYRIRICELLELEAFANCVVQVGEKAHTIFVTPQMKSDIEKWGHRIGDCFGTAPNHGVTLERELPSLSLLREDHEGIQLGELKSESSTCVFATNCALSKWDLPIKFEKTDVNHTVWCSPSEPIPQDLDLETLAMAAIAICARAEATKLCVEFPECVLDRTRIRSAPCDPILNSIEP